MNGRVVPFSAMPSQCASSNAFGFLVYFFRLPLKLLQIWQITSSWKLTPKKDCANPVVVRAGCIIHVSRPLLQLDRPERERGGHEIRSKKTSAAAVLQDLLYKRGVKPKGDIWRKAFTVLQDLLYRGGDQTKRWYLPHNQVPSTQVLEDLLCKRGDINQKVIFLPLQKFQVPSSKLCWVQTNW